MVEYIDQLVDSKILTITDYKLWEYIRNHCALNSQFVLITSSYDMIANVVAFRLGISDVIASRIAIEGEIISGRIAGECITGPARIKAMRNHIASLSLPCKCITSYYADHCSDIPILEWVDRPFAVNPDRRLRQYAQMRNWPILERNQ